MLKWVWHIYGGRKQFFKVRHMIKAKSVQLLEECEDSNKNVEVSPFFLFFSRQEMDVRGEKKIKNPNKLNILNRNVCSSSQIFIKKTQMFH